MTRRSGAGARKTPTEPPAESAWLRAGQIVAGLVLLTTAIASLTWPFGWDQGIFAANGRIVAEGGLPYRDAWEMKGPLVFYVYALPHWLFGTTTWGIRVVDAVLTAVTALGLWRLARQTLPRQAARTVPLIFALWYASGSYWHTAQPDAWAGGLIVGAMLLLSDSAQSTTLKYLAAGTAVGLATLHKPLYILFAGLPLLGAWLARDRRMSGAVAATAGLLAPLAAAAAWFAAHGALADFLYAYLEFPLTAYSPLSELPLSTVLTQLRDYLLPVSILLIAAPALAVGARAAFDRRERQDILLLVWATTAVGVVVIQRRFFEYHWTVAIPPLSMLVVVGFARMTDVMRAHRRALVVVGVYGLALTARLLAHPVVEVGHLVAWETGLQSTDSYEAHFGIGGLDRQVAGELRERLLPSDTLFIWGFDAGVGYLADRRSPSRFVWPPIYGPGSRFFDRFKAEYVGALRRTAPTFFVEGTETGSLVPDYRGLETFPEVAELVRTSYRLERSAGHLRIFRRISP